MFRFANPEYFFLLLLLPLMLALFFYVRYRYNKRLRKFGNPETIAQLMPEASWRKTTYKFILIGLALLFLIVAMARPQNGARLKEVKKKGVEIMLVVDVSNSMMAEDFSPSRLERTKYAINSLLDKFTDDRVGLIVFAGRAFVQLPITSDYITAKSFVDYVSPGMVNMQGTAIESALKLAGKSFSSGSADSRAIILISDGENHEDDPLAEAARLAKEGIIVSTIGIGTPEGAPISIGGEPIKDENGNIVVSKLNEELLKEIALETGGTYVRATNQSLGLNEIVDQIKKLDAREFGTTLFDEYNELYPYFAGIALLLLLLEFSLLERKNRIITRMRFFHIEEKE